MFGSPASVHPDASFWLDVLDKVVKLLAVLIGGLWTYVNIRISRIYRHKAEANVTATLHSRENALLLVINCQVKNIGQIKYDIKQQGTCAQVIGIPACGDEVEIRLFEIFKDHHWIEPGEMVTDPKYLLIPPHYLAIKTTMRIVSAKTEWNAGCITAIDNKHEDTAIERETL